MSLIIGSWKSRLRRESVAEWNFVFGPWGRIVVLKWYVPVAWPNPDPGMTQIPVQVVYKRCEKLLRNFLFNLIVAIPTCGLKQLESIEDVWELTSLQSSLHCLSNKENSIIGDISGENIDYPQEVPPQNDLLGGPFWGGTSWVHQSSESPTSIIMYYMHCFCSPG